jgi:2-polyprenyl-6-methoxyphenol hydroxylase-like FAD-dependent oxidoreductase
MMSPPAKRRGGRAAIVGGSLSGLLAALSLRAQGWDVEIFEQSPAPLAGRGAGIVSHDSIHRALGALGLVMDADFCVSISARRVYARDGSVVAAMAFPQTATSWESLFALLRGAFAGGPYRLGKQLTGFRADRHGVDLAFSDGSRFGADLLVGADGIRSAVRRALLPAVRPLYAGYVGWRGLVEEDALSEAARAALFDSLSFCLPAGEQMVGYPVAGREPGRRRYNFVWYRPAGEGDALDRLLTDRNGRRHGLSIPPPLVKAEDVARLRADAERLLAPPFVEVVRLAAAPFLQPIYDLAVPNMAFERVALVGDAAFVARPHVGAGVSKAAEDALALASALAAASDIAGGLARFESERLPVGRRIIRRARHLGSYIQAEIRTSEEEAAAARHGVPQAVMAETASVAFLDAPEAAGG